MDDDGENYFTNFEYQELEDAEFYGNDEWRIGKITWPTTPEWQADLEEMRIALGETPQDGWDFDLPQEDLLDDESNACEWDKPEIFDEDGELVEDEAAIIAITEMI